VHIVHGAPSHKVRQKNEAAAQDADDDKIVAMNAGGHFVGQFVHALRELAGGNQDIVNVVRFHSLNSVKVISGWNNLAKQQRLGKAKNNEHRFSQRAATWTGDSPLEWMGGVRPAVERRAGWL
jgi:hypothetical protein